MKKIIDVSEIEVVLEKLEIELFDGGAYAVKIRALLDKAPSVSGEAFGYFKAEPFGWTDCAETDEGAIALYEHQQPDRVAELEAENESLRNALARDTAKYINKRLELEATNKKLLDAAKDVASRLQGALIDSTFSINAARSINALRQAIAEADGK